MLISRSHHPIYIFNYSTNTVVLFIIFCLFRRRARFKVRVAPGIWSRARTSTSSGLCSGARILGQGMALARLEYGFGSLLRGRRGATVAAEHGAIFGGLVDPRRVIHILYMRERQM